MQTISTDITIIILMLARMMNRKTPMIYNLNLSVTYPKMQLKIVSEILCFLGLIIYQHNTLNINFKIIASSNKAPLNRRKINCSTLEN
jgi:hypothetical protein